MNSVYGGAGRWFGGMAVIAAALLASPRTLWPQAAPPPLSAEDAALVKLNAGRRAFNEKNYPFAADRFKEFLASNGGHREAASAWYGLGLCILQTPAPDYPAAVDAFSKAAASADLPDRPTALYYWGACIRAVGNKATADANARPNEAPNLLRVAAQNYDDAAKQFLEAQKAFTTRAQAQPAVDVAKPLPLDWEWAARARADLAEMQLRNGKYKEALETASPFIADPLLARSKYKEQGLYEVGYARFALRDYVAAGRALSQLAPFAQEFGMHARYLLARVHHLSDEKTQAAAQYKAVEDDFEVRKKTAQQTLQNPAALDPQQKAQLEALVNGQPSDYVLRSWFYSAVLLSEDAKYDDAAAIFTPFIQQHQQHALAPEARLRLGYCQLQSKKLNEAMQSLDPLKDDKLLGDRALWWMARAKVAAADPANPPAVNQALAAATDLLRRAAEVSRQQIPNDPDAVARRADILMELGDTLQQARQFKDAQATYQQITTEDPKSDRAEEAMQRRVTALHLAAQYKDSDDLADQFQKTYPKSTLLPAILFRQAENAYQIALDAMDEKNPHPREEQQKLLNAAVDRYQKFIAKYPEFEYVGMAKQGLGTCLARLGHYKEAIDTLVTIPESDRSGELATVPYLQADCEIRLLPAEIDDALTAERLIDTAADAARLLETFAGANPKSPQAPDALLKLGYCYQRMASQMANVDERGKTLAKAKDAYDRSLQQFPNDPTQPAVFFERARAMAMMGDVPNAINELRRFQGDPFRQTPNAPLAIVRLSMLLRQQNQPQPAFDAIKKCRDDYEGTLANDPARKDWIPLIRYEQGLALQDLHKLPEARAVFEEIVKLYPDKPEMFNAAWRVAQCRRQEAAEKLADARAVAARPGVAPPEVANAYVQADEPLKQLALASEQLRTQTEALSAKQAGSEAALRMLYELAWCYRVAANAETDIARMKLQQEAMARLKARWPKNQGGYSDSLAAPVIALSAVPIQPSEAKSRDCYQRVIFASPASELANQSRFELAELQGERGQIDPALDLLATALENRPSKELQQRMKVRVAALLLAKNDPKPALAQLQPILTDKDSPVGPEAVYLAGEVYVQQQDWNNAIQTLLPFRDQDPLRNNAALADRALMRLAYAYGQAKQWEPSRQTYEILTQRFPQSAWGDEARFGMGWALQNQTRYDEAVNVYGDLTHRSAAVAAARAQVNIGVCRLEQKRAEEALKALEIVPLTYDYAEEVAAAWYQSGRVHIVNQKPKDAVTCWQRVIKDYPTTSWAALSQQRLAEVK